MNSPAAEASPPIAVGSAAAPDRFDFRAVEAESRRVWTAGEAGDMPGGDGLPSALRRDPEAVRAIVRQDALARFGRAGSVALRTGSPGAAPGPVQSQAQTETQTRARAMRMLGLLDPDALRAAPGPDPRSRSPGPGSGTLAVEEVLAAYGADTLRLFALSDTPAANPRPWREEAVDGAWRFVNRLWLRVPADMAGAGRSEAPDRRADRAIRRASACYRRGAVHTAIAEARGLVKDLTDPGGGAPGSGRGSRAGWETALHLLNPVIPHVSEALWARMGHRTPLLARAWPVADRGGLVENRRTMPIHIDGRRRAVVSLPRGATRQVVARAALAVPAVRARLRDHVPRSVIVVPDRLVNIVL